MICLCVVFSNASEGFDEYYDGAGARCRLCVLVVPVVM